MCYTDYPHGMCVGIDRLVRMLRCWRGLTLAINARMAIAAKRQAGTSSLWWLGIRSLTTLGIVTVPAAKRTRATNVRNPSNPQHTAAITRHAPLVAGWFFVNNFRSALFTTPSAEVQSQVDLGGKPPPVRTAQSN